MVIFFQAHLDRICERPGKYIEERRPLCRREVSLSTTKKEKFSLRLMYTYDFISFQSNNLDVADIISHKMIDKVTKLTVEIQSRVTFKYLEKFLFLQIYVGNRTTEMTWPRARSLVFQCVRTAITNTNLGNICH